MSFPVVVRNLCVTAARRLGDSGSPKLLAVRIYKVREETLAIVLS